MKYLNKTAYMHKDITLCVYPVIFKTEANLSCLEFPKGINFLIFSNNYY